MDTKEHSTNSIDLSTAVVVLPPAASRREQNAARMLVEEIQKRTQMRLPVTSTLPAAGVPFIWLSQVKDLPQTLRPAFTGDKEPRQPEGYSIQIITSGSAPVVAAAASDERGVLFAAGCLLRNLRMEKRDLALQAGFAINTWPKIRLRGHQLGYRDKTNSYDAWDLRQWDQYVRDMAVFGTNAIELIPPRSDDNMDSVHFPLSPMETMAGMSQIADDYGLDLWIWYPPMDDDYSNPATVEFALKEWGEVLSKLPRIDAIFVPGGDPGNTPPQYLFPMLEKQYHQLHATHPNAKWWISPQGFSREWMTEFLNILHAEKSPDWLTGVVHGPWVHIPMEEFRKMIPEKYALRNYPDVTHSLNCQFAVPNWDVAYALTEGREIINPRPVDEAAIFKATLPGTIGFLTYSEGCHDDVNKFVWSGLGWDPDRPVIDTLREYSRYFIGEAYRDTFAQGLIALERNWRGSLLSNQGVYPTLQQFQALEEAAMPSVLLNWRFQQALYRAYYDAYVRARLVHETSLEDQAWDVLRQAKSKGTQWAIDQSERILDQAIQQPVAGAWRTRIFQLAEALFQSVRMQLSVHLYRGQEEVRGANLDGVDYPLNNAPWLKERLAELRQIPDEAGRLARIEELLHWSDPGPGGFYINLGSGDPSPYLVPGLSYEKDPAFLRTPARKYPYRKSPEAVRLAWRGLTGTLNDQPFQVHFPELDPLGEYRLRIVYGERQPHHPSVKVRLYADPEIEIHPFMDKPSPRAPLEFDIPQEATRSGELTLTWQRESGKGDVGLGCDLAELWLIKR